MREYGYSTGKRYCSVCERYFYPGPTTITTNSAGEIVHSECKYKFRKGPRARKNKERLQSHREKKEIETTAVAT